MGAAFSGYSRGNRYLASRVSLAARLSRAGSGFRQAAAGTGQRTGRLRRLRAVRHLRDDEGASETLAWPWVHHDQNSHQKSRTHVTVTQPGPHPPRTPRSHLSHPLRRQHARAAW